MTSKSNTQLSLFPREYFIHRILDSCQEQKRINRTVKVGELIKITPLLDSFRRRTK